MTIDVLITDDLPHDLAVEITRDRFTIPYQPSGEQNKTDAQLRGAEAAREVVADTFEPFIRTNPSGLVNLAKNATTYAANNGLPVDRVFEEDLFPDMFRLMQTPEGVAEPLITTAFDITMQKVGDTNINRLRELLFKQAEIRFSDLPFDLTAQLIELELSHIIATTEFKDRTANFFRLYRAVPILIAGSQVREYWGETGIIELPDHLRFPILDYESRYPDQDDSETTSE